MIDFIINQKFGSGSQFDWPLERWVASKSILYSRLNTKEQVIKDEDYPKIWKVNCLHSSIKSQVCDLSLSKTRFWQLDIFEAIYFLIPETTNDNVLHFHITSCHPGTMDTQLFSTGLVQPFQPVLDCKEPLLIVSKKRVQIKRYIQLYHSGQ